MKQGKSTATLVALLAILGVAACGPGEAAITAEITVEGPDGETVTRPLEDLTVQLVPYDRDLVFDSLAQAASTPEPQIPADILAAQEEVATAQQEWRDAETRWNTLRDTLQVLSAELERLNPGEPQYRRLYREWQDLDRQLSGLDRQVQANFARFEELQAATIERVDSVNLIKTQWEDDAFENVGEVMTAKLVASGLQIHTDTTDAQGMAVIEAAPGNYWVVARHELPYNELYWNVPISIVRGEPVQLRLSHDNAEVRPIY